MFVEGISPKWEDPNNKGGKYFTMEYQIKDDLDKFLPIFEHSWLQLMILVLAEYIDSVQYVNFYLMIDQWYTMY